MLSKDQLVRSLQIAAAIVIWSISGHAFAQSSATLTVAARVVAPCTISSSTLQSSCSERTLAQQSDIRHATVRITTSGAEAVVTHKGGLPPTIEQQGNLISVGF